jgi:hypothetical protein
MSVEKPKDIIAIIRKLDRLEMELYRPSPHPKAKEQRDRLALILAHHYIDTIRPDGQEGSNGNGTK